MIEVFYSSGVLETPLKLSFDQIREIVGGHVQMISLLQTNARGDVIHKGPERKVNLVQLCSNEDGLMLGLKFNAQVQRRFGRQLNSAYNPAPGQSPGPVGNWVVLSGKDKLR